MERAVSLVLYKEGNRKARLLRYQDAFEDYVEVFLPRIKGVEFTIEFVSFYRYQLWRYLKAKPVFTLSLPEGDMISDLIKDSYDSFLFDMEASPFNFRKVIPLPRHQDDEGKHCALQPIRSIFQQYFPCFIG